MAKNIDKKIEEALDIADTMKKFDSVEISSTDDKLRQRADERKQEVARIRVELEKKRDNTDEQFIKDSLKRLTEIGLVALEVLNEEVQHDPSGRAVECMSAMTNAVVNSVNSLRDYENDKQKIIIAKELADIKKANVPSIGVGGNANGSVVAVGRMQDVLKAIQDASFSNMKEAEKIADKEVFAESGPGTPFKKK